MKGIGARIKDKETSCQSISVNLQEELVILTQQDLSLFDLLCGPGFKMDHRSLQGFNLSILLHLFGESAVVGRNQGEAYPSDVRRIDNANAVNRRGVPAMIGLEAKGGLSGWYPICKLSISLCLHRQAPHFPFFRPDGQR